MAPTRRSALQSLGAASLGILVGCSAEPTGETSVSTSTSTTTRAGTGTETTEEREPTPLSAHGSWPMVQHDAGFTGVSAVDVGSIDSTAPHWRRDFYPARVCAAVDQVVYVVVGHEVRALDLVTGETKWAMNPHGGAVRAVAVDKDTIYATSYVAIHSLRTSDGTERWRYETKTGGISAPVVADGQVYAVRSSRRDQDEEWTKGALIAVDGQSGEKRWEYPIHVTPYSSPAVAGTSTFVGDWEGTIHAVDVQTGQRQWRTAGQHAFKNTPAADDRGVYIADVNETVYGLNPVDGSLKWTADRPSSQSDTLPGRQPGPLGSSPSLTADSVFVGDATGLAALRRTNGAVRWHTKVGGAATPALDRKRVYVGTADATLVALDRTTGERRWSLDEGEEQRRDLLYEEIADPPIPLDGGVAFSTNAGFVRAYGPSPES